MAIVETSYVNFSGNKVLAKYNSNISNPTTVGFVVSYTIPTPTLTSNDFFVVIPTFQSACFYVETGNTSCYIRAFNTKNGITDYGKTVDVFGIPRGFIKNGNTLSFTDCGIYSLEYANFVNGGSLNCMEAITCADKFGCTADNIIIYYYVNPYFLLGVNTNGDDFTLNGTILTIAPTVTTNSYTPTSLTTLNVVGEVTSEGGSTVTQRGICWNTSPYPTLANAYTINGSGTGVFTGVLDNIIPRSNYNVADVTYYARAYAINGGGTSYGNEIIVQSPLYAPVISGTFNGIQADLTWTDSNSTHEKYDLGRKINDGAWVNIAYLTYPTQSYSDTGLTSGNTYTYSVRGLYDSYTPDIYSQSSNGLALGINALIAPSNLTDVDLYCDGVNLGWTNNNNPADLDGNHIEYWNGYQWYYLTTVGPSATNVYIGGLTPLTTYQYRVLAYKGVYAVASQPYNVHTYNPAPFNLNGTIVADTITITFDLNDSNYGTAIRPEYRYSPTGEWFTHPDIAHDSTQYTYQDLAWGTYYEFRLVRIGSEYPSDPYIITTAEFLAPSNLHATLITDNEICVEWTNNSYNDYLTISISKNYEAPTYIGLPPTTTSYCYTGLTINTPYRVQVCNQISIPPPDYLYLCSNTINLSTGFIYLTPFCEDGGQYTAIFSTCGNNDGSITLNNYLYGVYYDLELRDIFNNVYTLSNPTIDNYVWTGLTASWYRITATPKQQFWIYYGKEPCVLEWIPIEDSNTTMSLTDTKIKDAVCGGFGGALGRIIYNMTDSNTGATTWTFNLYTEQYNLVSSQTLTDISAIVYTARPNIYYGTLRNNNGCTYLIDLTQVKSEKLYTVEGISRVFLTPWSSTIGYNYYDNTSEDWYQVGVDTQQFTSTKIAEFFDLPDFWYEIKLNTARMQYGQTLQKDSNGLTYFEEITITIPEANNTKWKQLTTLLQNRYIIVFEDNNGNWWTCFYRNGAEVKSYVLGNNQYTINFRYPVITKMLTGIDYNYVKLNIL